MPPRQDPSVEVVNDVSCSRKNDVVDTNIKTAAQQPFLLRMLPLLLGLDMFAVSLVVPLLIQYYEDAGIRTAHQREWLSSLFSASQIVGGLVLGVVTDTWQIQHTTVLQVTFLGSAISYALIVVGGLVPLLASRVLVGLVKHSMTVSTALVTMSTTTTGERAAHMARLTASMTVVWIVGPSVGAILYKHVNPKAPAVVATAVFLLNFGLVLYLSQQTKHQTTTTASKDATTKSATKKSSAWSNLQIIANSRALGTAVVVKLLATFVIRATSYHQLRQYYETMYGVETYHRGFLRSFEQTLSFLAQTLLVQRALQWLGGERRAVVVCAGVTAVVLLVETQQSLSLFLALVCPLQAVAQGLLQVSLQVIVSDVTPKAIIFSVFAALDILQNVVSVSSPFYRTLLFHTLTRYGYASEHGDPNPVAWLHVAAWHWIVVAIVTGYMLLVAWPQQPAATGKKVD